MKEVVYSRDAVKTLSRMPTNLVRQIRSKIEQYASNPKSLANNVKALKGMEGHYRLRVGDWRVIFAETGSVIAIIRIAPRSEGLCLGVAHERASHNDPKRRTPGCSA